MGFFMKKCILSLIMLLSLFAAGVSAEGNEVTVKVNNFVVKSPVPAQIVNDRTVLPMRSVFESFGARVTWMEDEKIIFATKGNLLITMQIDNNVMSVQQIENDEIKEIELDTAPFMMDGSTMVPVRAVAESLGYNVGWEPETRTVSISTIANEVN